MPPTPTKGHRLRSCRRPLTPTCLARLPARLGKPAVIVSRAPAGRSGSARCGLRALQEVLAAYAPPNARPGRGRRSIGSAGLISIQDASKICGLHPRALKRLIAAAVPLPKGKKGKREMTMFSLEDVVEWDRTRRRLIDVHAAKKLLGLPGYAVVGLEQIGRVRRHIGPAAIIRGAPSQSDLWIDADSILRLQRELEESARRSTDADRTISSLLGNDMRPGRWLDALELVLRDRAFGMVPGGGAVFDRVVVNPVDLAAARTGRFAILSQVEGTLSTRDAAEYLRTSENKVCLLMTAGAIEHVSGGRNRRRPLILSLCRFALNHVLSEEVDATGLSRKGLTRVLDLPRAWLRPPGVRERRLRVASGGSLGGSMSALHQKRTSRRDGSFRSMRSRGRHLAGLGLRIAH